MKPIDARGNPDCNSSVLTRGRLGVFFVCLAMLLGSLAFGHASNASIAPKPMQLAQASYPPPPPTPSPHPTPSHKPKPTPKKAHPTPRASGAPTNSCVETDGKNSKGYVKKANYHPGDPIYVRGASGCAAPNARVTTYYDPQGNGGILASSNAGSKGAYLNSGRIPRNAMQGQHVIETTTGKHRYSARINVVRNSGNAASRFLGSTKGLATLGIILALLALAVILSPRRRPRLMGSRGEKVDVPMLATSAFVPARGAPVKAAARKRAARAKRTS